MRKIRKDAKCHGTCGLLRSECWCGWTPPVSSPRGIVYGRPAHEAGLTRHAGRPRLEHLFDEYQVWEDDVPAWFEEAMYFHVKMLTVSEFASRFGANPIQVKHWIKQYGRPHCAWTWPQYYEDGKWVDFEKKGVPMEQLLQGIEPERVRKKRSHIKLMRYTAVRKTATAHRRIPESELKRCQFLKVHVPDEAESFGTKEAGDSLLELIDDA